MIDALDNSTDEVGVSDSEHLDFLVRLKDVSLHVPILSVKDRKLTINPIRMITELYGNSSGRSVKPLLLNIDFDVRPGERIGLIGNNGAGKTTLLRLIAGIYRPSSGVKELKGVAHGLFNIQLGMNANATGVENVYLRGLQMGMPLSEIRSHMGEIAKFTELGQSINDQFGNYSTGMKLRLAFAISTLLKPDVLLMDEWIGAGDENFKVKVKKRMDEMVEESKALIVATHSGPLMRRLCTRGVVLESGRIIFKGDVEEALVFHRDHQVRLKTNVNSK